MENLSLINLEERIAKIELDVLSKEADDDEKVFLSSNNLFYIIVIFHFDCYFL